jgi:hypothetical protein
MPGFKIPDDMEYRSVEQLLMDEGFLAWYRSSDRDRNAWWTQWIRASKENRELAEQAIDLLQSIEEVEGKSAVTAEGIERVWRAIDERTRKEE